MSLTKFIQGQRVLMKDDTGVINLFTIGFAKKNAEEFFGILKTAQIKKLIDVRLNNISQLAGFTKKNDLKYFLKEICRIAYEYRPEFAPTKDILDGYKKKEISWETYENKYNTLLIKRNIIGEIDSTDLNMSCFLCSEPTADKCHRRLLAEYLQIKFEGLKIIHL